MPRLRIIAEPRHHPLVELPLAAFAVRQLTVHIAKEGEMSKAYACRDAGMDCDWEESAQTEGELLRLIGKHLAEAHKMTDTSPDLLQQVRKAIKEG